MLPASASSQQRPKLFRGVARILGDLAHREGIDRGVSRDLHRARAVTHGDVFALPDDDEARFFKGTHRFALAEARQLRHWLRPW